MPTTFSGAGVHATVARFADAASVRKDRPIAPAAAVQSNLAAHCSRPRLLRHSHQGHDALPVFIKAEGLEWEWQQVWSFFGKHRRHLSFGGAVNAGVGLVCLPTIEISLRGCQTLEALAFEWCLLRMAHASFNFAFTIRIFDATR